MNKLRATFTKAVVFAAAVSGATAIACDLHGDGAFGSFASYHPMMQQAKSSPFLGISLLHTKKSLVMANRESNLSITYRVPSLYRKVSIEVEGSENIEILQNENVEILNTSGILRVKYKASEKGEHLISLKVTAVKNDKEEQFTQSVDVVAS